MGGHFFKEKLQTELEYDCGVSYHVRVNKRKLSKKNLLYSNRAGKGIPSCPKIESCCTSTMRPFERQKQIWTEQDWQESRRSVFRSGNPFVDLEWSDSDHFNSNENSCRMVDSEIENPELSLKAFPQIPKSFSSSMSWSSTLSESSTFKPNPITQVIPGKLYLGCEDNSTDEDQLLALGITNILCLSNRIHQIHGIENEHFVMSDMGRTELKTFLAQVYPYMKRSQKGDKKLFVHCKLGQNRSPTLVIAFLIKSRGLTLYEAHKMLKEKRPLVQIHRNYAKMLLKLERNLLGETSLPDDWMEVDGFGPLDGVPYFKSEELTVEEQKSFKISQKSLNPSSTDSILTYAL